MGTYKKLKIKKPTLVKKCAECHRTQASGRGCNGGISKCHNCGSTNMWAVPLGQEQRIHIPKVHTKEDNIPHLGRLEKR